MTANVTKSFYTSDEIWAQLEDIASAEGASVSAIITRTLMEFLLQRDFRSSWDTEPEDDWYDEHRFYTYSQDKKGHSTLARFTLPKNVAGQIYRIVDSGVIPELRSVGDFYRNAIFHWARRVARWVEDGELLATANFYMMSLEDETMRQSRRDFEEFIAGMRANLDEFLEDETFDHMRTYLIRRRKMTTFVPEQYRPEYETVLSEYEAKLNGES